MPAIELVLDCEHLDAQAGFWSRALDYEPFGEAGQYRALTPPPGQAGPKLILQQVPEARVAKNRMHLDLLADDIDAEATRLLALGAQRRGGVIHEHGHRWIPMADPEGNEFCVCAC